MTLAAILSGAAWVITGDWLAGLAALVICAVWYFIRVEEGPPVLQIALTMQWVQVSIGVFYCPITGRTLDTIALSDYRPMVLIGLGCIVAMLAGIVLVELRMARLPPVAGIRPLSAMSWRTLILSYMAFVVFGSALHQFAWDNPSVTQGLVSLSYVRLGLLYLMFRRLSRPVFRIGPIVALMLFEVGLGFTGFFAGFREPIIMGMLAMVEMFDRRKITHWAAMAGLVAVLGLASVFWISVRGDYRADMLTDENLASSQQARFERMASSASQWQSHESADMLDDVEHLVDRVWVIYYPALAVARVPSVEPHTGGAIFWDAISRVFMPRFLFPDKPYLMSDSAMVRRYAGVWVAGESEGTNIAFGYAAESYLDFGVPLMFLPVFGYGLFMGGIYYGFLRLLRHRDMAISFVTMICWMGLYLFERSWAKTIGLTFTLMLFVGLPAFIFDRLWLQKVLAQLPGDWDPDRAAIPLEQATSHPR